MKKILFLSACLLFITSAGSSQWYVQDVRTDADQLSSIDFLNENTGITCGAERILSTLSFNGRALYTTNGGVNWYQAIVPDSTFSLNSCEYINDDLSYIAGSYHDSSKGLPYFNPLLLKSLDGGKNWSTFATFPSEYDIVTQMDFINENTGYVTAIIIWDFYRSISCILKTTDAGQSWTNQLTLDSLSDLYSIQCISEDVIFAAGVDGQDEINRESIVLKSTDGGLNWERKVFDNLSIIDDLFFTDDVNGAFVGREDYGYIYRTTDEGRNWLKADSIPNMQSIIKIDFFPGSGTGLVYGVQSSGVHNIVFKTTDYGISWTQQLMPVSPLQSLIAGVMISETNFYLTTTALEYNAAIVHTTNGGSTSISNSSISIPEEFTLEQNYPNPFNPVTSIAYSISNQQLITLKVFDVLGNYLTTLVNEKQNSGLYTVNWNASSYSSGIYFYSLEGGKFSETKKMLLIK